MTSNKNIVNCNTPSRENAGETLRSAAVATTDISAITDNAATDHTNQTAATTTTTAGVDAAANHSVSGTAALATGSIEAEFKRIQECGGWLRLYQDIRQKSEREGYEKNYSTRESEKMKNRVLNRYRDVNPYDHSRIILHRGNVDYINANLVKVNRANRKYILTQGPLPDTVGHFWLMVWEQNSRAILMLNKIIEKKQVKCHKYWPIATGTDNAIKLPELKLIVEYLRSAQYKNFICRWFKLSDMDTKETREIVQFHYTTWPDFGIPSSPVAFLQFLKQVRNSGYLESTVGPAIVHCSAGIGRSGTFCLVDCCLVLFEKEGEDNVSVQDVLFEMRRYRMGLIQTSDQLYFSYQAIIEGMKLFKDPNFLNYHETPTSVNDMDEKYADMDGDANVDRRQSAGYQSDENPPPLPPRTQSLQSTVNNGNEQILTSGKDALNNIIGHEIITQRPLPPLPPFHENGSAQNGFDEEDEEDDDDDTDELENDDSDIANDINNANDDDDDGGDDDYSDDDINLIASNNLALNADDQANANDVHKKSLQYNFINNTNSTLFQHADGSVAVNDMNETTTNVTHQRELRRRKRAERQNNLEKIVHEIKRKQRELNDETSAKSKRFTNFNGFGQGNWVACLAAGVFVGAICVYAYTKMV